MVGAYANGDRTADLDASIDGDELLGGRRERIRTRFQGVPVESDGVRAVRGAMTGRGVLSGAFAILRALPFAPESGQIAALARATGVPRSSVHRLLDQLRDVGAVELRDGRYSIAAGVMLLANLAEPSRGVRDAYRGILVSLAATTGTTVSCVVEDGADPYVLDVVAGREVLPVDIYPGREMPAGSSAAVALQEAMEAPPGQTRFSAIDREAVVAGLTCYAVTFTLPLGRKAALQLSSTPRLPAERFASLANRAAAVIEGRLRQGERPADRPSPRPLRP